jgi:hypothetical protein
VASHFENYANKLLKAVGPQADQKDGTSGGDNTTQHACPFVRVANAVGFPIKGVNSSKSGDAGSENSPESLKAQSAQAGGAPASAIQAALEGGTPSGACPVK